MRKFTQAVACCGLALVALGGIANAMERQLTGAEISALLPTIKAFGQDTVQVFSKNGRTKYHTGGFESKGSWWVTASQYCSSWPPSNSRACYDVFLDESKDPKLLIWIGDSGARTVNTFTPQVSVSDRSSQVLQ